MADRPNSQSNDLVASSRRRAAERVRLRLNRDKKQWHIHGKKPSRKAKPKPPSRIHNAPWNDRFIFDEDHELVKGAKGAAAAANLCKASKKANEEATDSNIRRNEEFTRMQPKSQEFDSEAKKKQNRSKTHPDIQSAGEVIGSVIRSYTERSDGEKVIEFQRHEIIPARSSIPLDPNPSTSNLIGSSNVAVSPFDVAKVSSVLEDHAVRNGQDRYSSKVNLTDETNTPLSSLINHFANHQRRIPSTQEYENYEFIKNGQSFQKKNILDLHGLNKTSLLDSIEEILYTMELEEDLVYQELAQRKRTYIDEFDGLALINFDTNNTNSRLLVQSNFEKNGHCHDEDQGIAICQQKHEPCSAVMKEPIFRRSNDAITQYITKQRRFRDFVEMPLLQNGGLRFHEIIEM